MNFWEKVKRDLQKGVKEGVHVVKGGVAFAKKKAEVITEEGKKRYKVHEIKAKVQKEIAELGGQVYDLSSKVENPMQDSKVKEIVARINKLETQITELEEKPRAAPKKAPKKATVKKKDKQ